MIPDIRSSMKTVGQPHPGKGQCQRVGFGKKVEMSFSLALLGALFLCIPVSAARGQEFSCVESSAVRVIFQDPALETSAREVADRYPFIRESLESAFLWEMDFRPLVLLVNDRRAFLNMAGHEAFVAYAVPERQLVVIDATQMGVRPFTLAITLKHELCHLLLHHHITEVHLPKWLDEGVCQWISEGVPEVVFARGLSPLPAAVLMGELISLEALSSRFPGDNRGLFLAYEQSRSVVDYIIQTYGVNGILNILHSMKNGVQAEESIQTALMITGRELEKRWHEDLRSWPVFLAFLAGNLYTVLFIIAALLTVLAYVRFLLRKRSYRLQEEQDAGRPENGQG